MFKNISLDWAVCKPDATYNNTCKYAAHLDNQWLFVPMSVREKPIIGVVLTVLSRLTFLDHANV